VVDDGRGVLAADCAEVRDGERAALHLLAADISVAGLLDEFVRLGGQLEQPLPVNVIYDGDHQPRISCRGDADVVVLLVVNLLALLVEFGVQDGELLQRRRDCLQHERRVGEFDAALLGSGLEVGPGLDEFVHDGGVVVGYVWDGCRGLVHLLADGPADAAVGLRADRSRRLTRSGRVDRLCLPRRFLLGGNRLLPACGCFASGRAARAARLRERANVVRFDDGLAVAGLFGGHLVQVDAQFAGDLSGCRCGQRPVAVRRLGSRLRGRAIVLLRRLATCGLLACRLSLRTVRRCARFPTGFGRFARGFHGRAHVSLCDPAARPGAIDSGDVDAEFAGQSADVRRCEHPLVVADCDLLCVCCWVRLCSRFAAATCCRIASPTAVLARFDLDLVGFLAVDVDGDDDAADGDDIAGLGVQFRDCAIHRGGQVNDRLVCLDLGQHLVLLDVVADVDVPGDDFTLCDPLADVREFVLESHAQNSTVSVMPSLIRAGSGM